MCDYSLMGVRNRLGREGEDLIVHQFSTGTRGLVADISEMSTDTAQRQCRGFRSLMKQFFEQFEPKDVEPFAICIPPGARLLLSDIPENLQNSFGVGPSEKVTFTQLTATPNRYRDAVRFANGREILLQRLNEGQRVRVLQLSLVEEPVQSVWKSAELFR